MNEQSPLQPQLQGQVGTGPAGPGFERATKLNELYLMPRAFDCPFYPGSIPVSASSWRINSLSVRSHIILYYDFVCGVITEPAPQVLEVLRQWFLYYLHAPCWRVANLEQYQAFLEKCWTIDSWQDLQQAEQAAFSQFFIEPF